jgi:hypothetical protein
MEAQKSCVAMTSTYLSLLEGGFDMKTINVLIASGACMFAPWVQADSSATSRTTTNERAELTSQVQRTIAAFVAACSAHDAQRLDSITTDDVRIEYALETPGAFLTLDATSLPTDCGIGVRSEGSISRLWIYPTNDANAVFVEFDATSDSSSPPRRQLALVEMRDAQIARLLNFSAPPDALLGAEKTAQPSFSANAAAREATLGSD